MKLEIDKYLRLFVFAAITHIIQNLWISWDIDSMHGLLIVFLYVTPL